MVLGGPKECVVHIKWKLAPVGTKLMFYSLQYSFPGQSRASKIQYNTFYLSLKNTVTPFGPPTIIAVVVDFKDWAGDVRSPTPGT